MLLFGVETWVLTPRMERALGRETSPTYVAPDATLWSPVCALKSSHPARAFYKAGVAGSVAVRGGDMGAYP